MISAALSAVAALLVAQASVEFTTADRTVLDSAGGLIVVELRSTDPFAVDTKIGVTVGPSTAVEAVDFRLPSPVAYFPAGSSEAFLKIILLGNPKAEGDRTLVLTLADPPPGVEIGLKSRLSLTLKASAAESFYGFERATYYVNESAGTARLRVRRFGDPSGPGSVSFSVLAGTAGSSDAALGSGTVPVAAGESAGELTVKINDDAVAQGDRDLQLVLPAVAGRPEALITSARLVIVDNDGVFPRPIYNDRYQKGGLIEVYTVAFATQPGFRYAVEYSDTNVTGPWLELQTIVGDGELHSADDLRPISAAGGRFYRYRLEDDPVTR